MKQIRISDTTLLAPATSLSFKEKLEIARKLERLSVDAIELPALSGGKSESLLVRTVASFVKNSVISVGASASVEEVERAKEALTTAAHPRIRIELPMSAAIMEYSLHKKQDKMADFIRQMIGAAKEAVDDVEFVAVDATRAEKAFLREALEAAVEAGASSVTLADSAAALMPDDFASFVDEMTDGLDVSVGVYASDKNALSVAASALAVKQGAVTVKTSVGGDAAPLRAFAAMIENVRINYEIETSLRATELHRVIDQIEWVLGGKNTESVKPFSPDLNDSGIKLGINDTKDTVYDAVQKLGYDLSDEDLGKVYEEFRRIARKKAVGYKELDAIVASTALQVPATFTIESYVINSGNIITASAQLSVTKDGRSIAGIATGDGPIDAAFRALDQIVGRHFELDDFAIQTVTGEKEAMGSALVRLRSGGKIYSGTGLSTDIIGASVRAYINAVNKIVYEED